MKRYVWPRVVTLWERVAVVATSRGSRMSGFSVELVCRSPIRVRRWPGTLVRLCVATRQVMGSGRLLGLSRGGGVV